MGEFRALSEIEHGFHDGILPFVEVPLNAAEDNEDENDPGVRGDVVKFAADVERRWFPERRLIFDSSLVPSTGPVHPTVQVIESLAPKEFSVTPTIRPSDDPTALVLVRDTIKAWRLDTACIRLAGDDLDDNELPLSRAISQLVEMLDLPPERIDVMLDFGNVANEQAASFSARIARIVLAELPFRDRWRTLSCAAGAFPADLNSIQAEVLTEQPRYDAIMWTLISERVSGRVPTYGDYAIAYPTPSSGVPFAPAPQLRYTWEGNWLIYKGRKRDRRGHAQFYDICARIVAAGVVDERLSWGDMYVSRAAKPAPELGTGNAMIWRAIGTSHHMAYVANRLANIGAP
jgi:hypothetical protein